MPEKTLMDQARTLFWLADGGGRLIYVNGAFYRQFGVEGGSAGKNLQEMIPRDMAVFFSEKHRRVSQSGVPIERCIILPARMGDAAVSWSISIPSIRPVSR